MGYHVEVIEGSITIKKEHLDKAYKAMCDLNTTHHDHKRGGSYSSGKPDQKWFSWMDANYPDTCKDSSAILNQLGFETEYDDNDNLVINGYESKSGQEELFLQAIAPYSSGYLNWRGEDGAIFQTKIVRKKLVIKEGKIIFK